MKIAISGAQSTGKTTLINELEKLDFFKEFNFLTEITREVKRKGFPINEDGNNLTQIFIINSHIERFYSNTNFICDRCILDGLVYTNYLYYNGKVDRWVLDYAFEVYKILINKYDIIFFIQPEFSIIDDGIRSTNKQFRDDIIEHFNHYIKNCDNIVYINGDNKTRIENIIKVVKEKSCNE